MKKIVSLILAFTFILGVASVSVTAHDGCAQDNCCHKEFIFGENIPEEMKERIIADLSGENTDSGIAAYNILCNLFGHNYDSIDVTTTITHKVRSSAPRCLEEKFDVQLCSRCSYSNYELFYSAYINCCS